MSEESPRVRNVRLVVGGRVKLKGSLDDPDFEKKFKEKVAEEAWNLILWEKKHSLGFPNLSIKIQAKLFHERWKK